MKVTQEKLPASQLGLEIEISAETTKSTYEKMVDNLSRTTNIQGFRKGKVPRQILIQRLGSRQIKAAALEQMLQTSLKEAIEQESIEPLGNYQIRSDFEELLGKYTPGESLTFSAAVDVTPEVKLGEYTGLSVKAEESLYEAEEVDKTIERMREQKASLVPVENRSAQMGDVIIVDFEGKLTAEGQEGELIQGGQAKDFQIEMEEGRLIAGMIEGIVGMNPDETKEVAVTFPEDYGAAELAGKPAVFTIILKEIKEKELPELDDDFAEEASEFATVAELRESLEKQYREKAENETKNNVYGAIVKELLPKCEIDLPETMIQEEVTSLLTQTFMQMQQYGVDVKQLFNAETIPKFRDNARPEAIENVKTTLILAEIAQKENLVPTTETIEAKEKELTEQVKDRDIDYDKLRSMVTEDLTKENVLGWLKEKTTVELVPKGSLTPEDEDDEDEKEEEE
jgi:trigger factor